MVFVVAVAGVVAVWAVFTQCDDGVVSVVTILLVQTRVYNTGNQRAVFRFQQVIHHTQKTLLVNFQVRNSGFWPDDEL